MLPTTPSSSLDPDIGPCVTIVLLSPGVAPRQWRIPPDDGLRGYLNHYFFLQLSSFAIYG